MAKKVKFAVGRKATVVLAAKHKGPKTKLYIFPAGSNVATRTPMDPRDYSKKDALAILEFPNAQSIGTMIAFLHKMRDHAIHGEYIDKVNAQNAIIEIFANIAMAQEADKMRGKVKRGKKPEATVTNDKLSNAES